MRKERRKRELNCALSRSRAGLAGKGARRRMGREQCLASSTLCWVIS